MSARCIKPERNNCRNKAVASGAVSFFLDHFVSSRVMKMSYGTSSCVRYDPDDPEHYARRHRKHVQPSGQVALRHRFDTILKEVCLSCLSLKTKSRSRDKTLTYGFRAPVCTRTKKYTGATTNRGKKQAHWTRSGARCSAAGEGRRRGGRMSTPVSGSGFC